MDRLASAAGRHFVRRYGWFTNLEKVVLVMTRLASILIVLSLSACAEQSKPSDSTIRHRAIEASAADLIGEVQLRTLGDVAFWSAQNRTQIAKYASPSPEGVGWIVPGLSCPAPSFSKMVYLEISAPFPLSAEIARALERHNRQILQSARSLEALDCIEFVDSPEDDKR